MTTFGLVFLAALALATGTKLWLAMRHLGHIRRHRDAFFVDRLDGYFRRLLLAGGRRMHHGNGEQQKRVPNIMKRVMRCHDFGSEREARHAT